MKDTIRIQYQTADGIKMYDRQPREVLRSREIRRVCMKILRVDGAERPMDKLVTCESRKYILWTQLPNGTFVFREDN